MSKFGDFFARKASTAKAPATPADAENPLELDEELFSARGTQIGAENELLRNLLFDASAKIDELDGIKRLVGKLVDPVGKALRAIEAEQVEKAALQTVLNNTRTAYGKLRNEFAELEKNYAASDGERRRLRQEFGVAFGQLKAAEIAKTDLATDNTARRAQIAQLEARPRPGGRQSKGAGRREPPLQRPPQGGSQAHQHAGIRSRRRPPALARCRRRKARASDPARSRRQRGRRTLAQARRGRVGPPYRAKPCAPRPGQLRRTQCRA